MAARWGSVWLRQKKTRARASGVCRRNFSLHARPAAPDRLLDGMRSSNTFGPSDLESTCCSARPARRARNRGAQHATAVVAGRVWSLDLVHAWPGRADARVNTRCATPAGSCPCTHRRGWRAHPSATHDGIIRHPRRVAAAQRAANHVVRSVGDPRRVSVMLRTNEPPCQ